MTENCPHIFQFESPNDLSNTLNLSNISSDNSRIPSFIYPGNLHAITNESITMLDDSSMDGQLDKQSKYKIQDDNTILKCQIKDPKVFMQITNNLINSSKNKFPSNNVREVLMPDAISNDNEIQFPILINSACLNKISQETQTEFTDLSKEQIKKLQKESELLKIQLNKERIISNNLVAQCKMLEKQIENLKREHNNDISTIHDLNEKLIKADQKAKILLEETKCGKKSKIENENTFHKINITNKTRIDGKIKLNKEKSIELMIEGTPNLTTNKSTMKRSASHHKTDLKESKSSMPKGIKPQLEKLILKCAKSSSKIQANKEKQKSGNKTYQRIPLTKLQSKVNISINKSACAKRPPEGKSTHKIIVKENETNESSSIVPGVRNIKIKSCMTQRVNKVKIDANKENEMTKVNLKYENSFNPFVDCIYGKM